MADLFNSSEQFATIVRREALKMVHRARASHIGGALSMADILAVLYTGVARVDPADPNMPSRDRILLSKGHSCTALYAALALRRFIPTSELETYGKDGSRLLAHASHKVPGVEFSTGSLGHALPFGVGKALAAKRLSKGWRVFVILSDGELDEGSNWEAILFAPHHKLDNLTVVIDYNKIQSLGDVDTVMPLDDLAQKFRAFHWVVTEIDGHDHGALKSAFAIRPERRPHCIIAHTVKGKGVSFMENKLAWHYRSPDDQLLAQALSELGGA